MPWLQYRVDHLEILQGLLRRRIRDMEQQNAYLLQLKMDDMAETRRLKLAIEQWEEMNKNHHDNGTRFCRSTITLEQDSRHVVGGGKGVSKPSGLDESEEDETEESSLEDNIEDDEYVDDDEYGSLYGTTPMKSKARKAAVVSGDKNKTNSSNKKTKTTKRQWTPGNTTHYHIYHCPVMGCD